MDRNAVVANIFARVLSDTKDPAKAAKAASDAATLPEELLAVFAAGTAGTDRVAQLERKLREGEEIRAAERATKTARVAKRCPIQPDIFLNHGPELNTRDFEDQLVEPRRFDTGSIGYFARGKVHVTLTLPGGPATDLHLNYQLNATVIHSKGMTDSERDAAFAKLESLKVRDIIGGMLAPKTLDDVFPVKPRAFSTGSVGYYVTGRVDDTLHVGINVTLPGSKAAAGL